MTILKEYSIRYLLLSKILQEYHLLSAKKIIPYPVNQGWGKDARFCLSNPIGLKQSSISGLILYAAGFRPENILPRGDWDFGSCWKVFLPNDVFVSEILEPKEIYQKSFKKSYRRMAVGLVDHFGYLDTYGRYGSLPEFSASCKIAASLSKNQGIIFRKMSIYEG